MTRHTTTPSIVAESSHRFDFVGGHSDQGGRADGVQVMVSGGHAYVAHVFSGGCHRARRSQPASTRAGEPPAGASALVVHPPADPWRLDAGVEEFNFCSVFAKEQDYYGHSIEGVSSARFGTRGEDYSAGSLQGRYQHRREEALTSPPSGTLKLSTG